MLQLYLFLLLLTPIHSTSCTSGWQLEDIHDRGFSAECDGVTGKFLRGIKFGLNNAGAVIQVTTCAKMVCCAGDLRVGRMGQRGRGEFDLYVNSTWDENKTVGLEEAVGVEMFCGVGAKLKPKSGPTCVVDDAAVSKWDYECMECVQGQYYDITKNKCRDCSADTHSPTASDVCCPCTHVLNLAKTRCVTCPSHQIPNESKTGCMNCPSPQIPNESKTGCEYCDRGKVLQGGRCRACPAGHTTYPEEDRGVCVGPRYLLNYPRNYPIFEL